MNNRLALIICVLLAFHVGACTSNDSRDDEAAAEESMDGDESLEDVEGLDDEGGEVADDTSSDASFEEAPADATADAGAATGDEAEGFSEDALSDDGSAAVAETPPADGAAPAAGGFSENDMAADPAFADTPPAVDPGGESAQVVETPPVSEPPPAAETASNSSFDSGSGSSSGGGRSYPVIPLKKIEAAPFERDGVLLNAVYFARPGDTFSKVAKMIYSDGKKTKVLKNINPDTMPRVGDPIYYNSPNRPTDNTAMKVYYEDAGIQPKIYMANEGDDLKKVSKSLLGFDGAWKEVWASNSVESKSKVPSGTEIRYYSESEMAPAVVANNEMSSPAAQDLGMPPDNGMPAAPDAGIPPDNGMPAAPDAGMPPLDMGMPPDQMADAPAPPPDNMLPPPDAAPPMDAGMGGMNDMPPQDMAPPPPPPPPPPPENNTVAARPDLAADGSDNDMLMALGAAGGIAVLLAGLMIMRRRRQQREMAAAFGDTQVGT